MLLQWEDWLSHAKHNWLIIEKRDNWRKSYSNHSHSLGLSSKIKIDEWMLVSTSYLVEINISEPQNNDIFFQLRHSFYRLWLFSQKLEFISEDIENRLNPFVTGHHCRCIGNEFFTRLRCFTAGVKINREVVERELYWRSIGRFWKILWKNVSIGLNLS